MAIQIGKRLQHAWNAFLGRDPTNQPYISYGSGMGMQMYQHNYSFARVDSIISMIYNRIANDVASVNIRHVYLDKEGRFDHYAISGLNNCLITNANDDQTGRQFILDAVLSMFDEGCIALVPTEADIPPNPTGSYDIQKMQVGQIMEWFPEHVRVNLYNPYRGIKEDLVFEKLKVAIIENPFYTVMNEPNSIAKRLARKLSLIDISDERTGANKLDLILQMPGSLKTDLRKKQASNRLQAIEEQMSTSKYGIAYIDSTERITQLNRPVENNLLQQVQYYVQLLFNQLGLTPEIMAGTADEATMLNYYNRTIDPILTAICESMEWKFLTKTARTQGQAIRYYRDLFKLVPVGQIAEIADKFTRNEIFTSNEIRSFMGIKPSSDPSADELRNKNLNPSEFEGKGQNGSENEKGENNEV